MVTLLEFYQFAKKTISAVAVNLDLFDAVGSIGN